MARHPPTRDLLGARARVPGHVVYRSFDAETVVLNLSTGKYHGLNPTAGRMLEEIARAPTVGASVAELARGYGGVGAAQVARDLVALCHELLARGLIEIVDAERE